MIDIRSYANLVKKETMVALKEPTGFPNRTDSAWTFNDGTLKLTVTVVSGSYDIWFKGVKHTISTTKEIPITDVEGIHVVYFDTDDTLKEYVNPTIAQVLTAITDKCLVGIIYWDATNKVSVMYTEERHGTVMDGITHFYLHYTRGLQYVSGLALGDFVIGDGSLDTHAQFSIGSGMIADEDIGLSPSAVASTTGLPILYKLGANAYWRRTTQAGFAVKKSGSATDRLYYNLNTGGTWSLAEVGEANYVLCHVYVYSGKVEQLFAIMGEAEYATLNLARAGAQTEIASITVGNLPSPEMRPVATVIFQTDKDYGNTINARVVEITTGGDDYVSWLTTDLPRGVTPADHQSLSNLQLAQSGSTYGHIDDQTQTIAGNKNFSGTTTIATPFTLGAVSVTTTGTQLNYLTSATGTTGTTTGKVVFDTAPTFTTSITTPSVLATANDSGALGASGTAFSDLFLASGGAIDWAAGNSTITHENSNGLTFAGATKGHIALSALSSSYAQTNTVLSITAPFSIDGGETCYGIRITSVLGDADGSYVTGFSSEMKPALGGNYGDVYYHFSVQTPPQLNTSVDSEYGFAVLGMGNGSGKTAFYSNLAASGDNYNIYFTQPTQNYIAGGLNLNGNLAIGNGNTNATNALDVYGATGAVVRIGNTDSSITAGDTIGKIEFYAKDQATTTSPIGAYIQVTANSTIASNINPTNMYFYTTNNGVASSPQLRFAIYASGITKVNSYYSSGVEDGYFSANKTDNTSANSVQGAYFFRNCSVASAYERVNILAYTFTTHGSGTMAKSIGIVSTIDNQSENATLTTGVSFLSRATTTGDPSVLTNRIGFQVEDVVIGSGSCTNQIGFYCDDLASGDGYMRGIELKVNVDTNKHNIYVSGTADNYIKGNVGINTTTFGTSAASVLALGTGTAPSTSPADLIQLFAVDLSAGNCTLGLRTETAVVSEAVTSDRTLSVVINGTTYKILLKA